MSIQNDWEDHDCTLTPEDSCMACEAYYLERIAATCPKHREVTFAGDGERIDEIYSLLGRIAVQAKMTGNKRLIDLVKNLDKEISRSLIPF